jgi:hypothetical protein
MRVCADCGTQGMRDSHEPKSGESSQTEDDDFVSLRHPQVTCARMRAVTFNHRHTLPSLQAVVSTEHEFLYYLSDGVYGSFNNIIFDHAKPQPVLLDLSTVFVLLIVDFWVLFCVLPSSSFPFRCTKRVIISPTGCSIAQTLVDALQEPSVWAHMRLH